MLYISHSWTNDIREIPTVEGVATSFPPVRTPAQTKLQWSYHRNDGSLRSQHGREFPGRKTKIRLVMWRWLW